MEDKNKMDQQSGRPNRDQETERKPTQGSQEMNRQGQGNVQQGQQGQSQQGQSQQGRQGQQGQQGQQDREKKSA
jgi:hypothetical protein